MTNLTTKQIREILASAPDGDNHFLELDGNYTRYTKLASAHHSLSDLREILALRERVAEIESQQQWISVDKRLPGHAFVIAFRPKDKLNPIATIKYDAIMERWGGDNKVTHWMPLPQPPKENTNE